MMRLWERELAERSTTLRLPRSTPKAAPQRSSAPTSIA